MAESQPEWLILVDALALAAVDLALRIEPAFSGRRISIGSLAGLSLVTLLLLARFGLYAVGPRPDILDELGKIVGASSIAVSAMIVLPLPAADALTRRQALHVWLLATSALVVFRILVIQLKPTRARILNVPTLIVGAGRVGRLLEERLFKHPTLGLNPIGFVDDDPLIGETESSLPVLGGYRDLERIVGEHGVRHVIVTFSAASNDTLLHLIRRCEALDVSVSVVPRLYETMTHATSVVHLGGLPLLSVRPARIRGPWIRIKYALDRVGAAAILIVLAPVYAVVAVAIWGSLGRPILFRQLRVGRDGNSFEMLKFRSMRELEPADMVSDLRPLANGFIDDSLRVSRVGSFIRRMSLDELPQVINVLKGEMSFVGPRPERPELVPTFASRIYRYNDRHRVKAGITGWTQIHGIGRGDHRFSDAALADRAEWDNYYIENWSPWLDLKIVLLTPATIWRFRQGSTGASTATHDQVETRIMSPDSA